MNFVRNTHCLSKELRPVTRSSSASSLMSLETRSSTNWSSFVCLDDPVDEVVEDELELGSEPVIMAVDVVGKLKLSPSVNFRHLFSIFAKLDLEKRGDWKKLTFERWNVANDRHEKRCRLSSQLPSSWAFLPFRAMQNWAFACSSTTLDLDVRRVSKLCHFSICS